MEEKFEKTFDDLFLDNSKNKSKINIDNELLENLKKIQLKTEYMTQSEIKNNYFDILRELQKIVEKYEKTNKELYEKIGKYIEKQTDIMKLYSGILKKITENFTVEEKIKIIKELIDNRNEPKIIIARLFNVLKKDEKIQVENEIVEYLKFDKYELKLIFKYLNIENKRNIIDLYRNDLRFLCEIWKYTDEEIQTNMFEVILGDILDSRYCDNIVDFIKYTAEEVKRQKLTLKLFKQIYEKDILYLIKIWESFSDSMQVEYIEDIIILMEENNIYKNGQFNNIYSIYINSNVECQEKLWNLFFNYEERDKYDILWLWEKTKKNLQKKKIFEIIDYYKNKESAEYDINSIWRKTQSCVQDQLINRILNEDFESKIKEAIWDGTDKNVQRRNIFLLKEGENLSFWKGTYYLIQDEKFLEYLNKKECIEDKLELWCNTNSKVQEKYDGIFLELLKDVYQDDIMLYKLIKNTSDNIKIIKLSETFSIIKNNNDTLIKIWEYSSADFQIKMFERFFIDNFVQSDLIINLWNVTSSIVQDEKFYYISSIVEKNIKEQISFWKCTSERIQNKYEEYFYKICEKENLDIEDMVFLWINTSFKIQKKNEEMLGKIYKQISKKNNKSKILMQKIWNGTTCELVNNNSFFVKAIKIIYAETDKLDIKYMYKYYNRLLEFNSDINYTINLQMLDKKILDIFDIGDLLKITLYPELQEKMVKLAIRNINIINIIYKQAENWILEIDNILNNMENYKEILEIVDNDILQNRKFCQNLISLMSVKNNYFNINTIREVEEYDKIKYNTCINVLNEKLQDINFVDKKYIKKFALLEILFDIDYEFGKRITEKYATNIMEINAINEEEKEVKENIIRIKKIVNENKIDINLKHLRRNKIKPVDFENKCIMLYERLYNEQMKLPIIEIEKEEYDNKEVKVYKAKNEFCILVRVEGAYSYWKEPENFEKNIAEININLNGNPKTYIANNSMAIARPKGPIYGYTRKLRNNMLLMAPWDIVSNDANLSFSPSSVNWDFGNGISFRTPNNLLNSMRSSHNEIVTLKWNFNKYNMKIERDKPNVIIYFIDMIENKNTYKETNSWRLSKKAAVQLNIPIVIINREEVFKNEKEKIKKLVEEFFINPDEETLEEIFLQFENNRSSMRYVNDKLKMRYFTAEERENLLKKIIDRINKTNINEKKNLINKLIKIANNEINKYYSNKKCILYMAEKDISFYKDLLKACINWTSY